MSDKINLVKVSAYSLIALRNLLVILGSVIFLSSCVSTKNVFTTSKTHNWEALYLRGVFTWWEAEEQYRVHKVEEDLYRVSVELVADGQPYDFKFADRHWSPGLRCGYANKDQDQTLRLGLAVKANCDTQVNNFKFTPGQSGEFHFYFDARIQDQPSVYIVAANKS